jgi:hypothetical protein
MSMLVSTPVELGGREQVVGLHASVYDVTVENVRQDGQQVAWQQEGRVLVVVSPRSFAVSPLAVRFVAGGYAVECTMEMAPTPCDATSIGGAFPDSTDQHA